MQAMSVVLVGIGGWGWVYVDALLDAAETHGCRFVAAVDPEPAGCRRLADIRARGIPIYSSLDEFYALHTADLAVISTPPHLHVDHACLAMRNGSDVLCEKPVACSPAGAARMALARDRCGRRVAIGYQWSFSRAVQQLKRDVSAGRLGEPRRFRTLVQWPRGGHYYGRNGWAGRMHDGEGRPVLDSPLNNACAHFLHNALYLIGGAPDASAVPRFAQAELYRANGIENYDTAILRCTGGAGFPEMLFVVSHTTARERKPLIEYEFERATVHYDQADGARLVARFDDGSVQDYGNPDAGGFAGKLWNTTDALRAGLPFPCGVEAATAHALCVSAAQRCVDGVAAFPGDRIVAAHDAEWGNVSAVRGLEAELERCYRERKLPHELGIDWARAGRVVDVGSMPVVPIEDSPIEDGSDTLAVSVTVAATIARLRPSERPGHE